MNGAPALVDHRIGEQPFDGAGAIGGRNFRNLSRLFGNVDMHRPVAQAHHGGQHVRRHGAQTVRRNTDLRIGRQAGDDPRRRLIKRCKAVKV